MKKKRGSAAVRELVTKVLDAVDEANGGEGGDDNVITVTARPPRIDIKPRMDLNLTTAMPSEQTMKHWESVFALRPAQEDADDKNVIQIFDAIGYDYWTGGGITAKTISDQLAKFGGADVEVQINSPGGDMFEGIAIYNALQQYKGNITCKVLGIAASAASIIAMAGDTREIGLGAFIMIHNCWVIAIGNQNDFRECADYLAEFDDALASIYVAATGQDKAEIAKMMDDETYLNAEKSVDLGFATDTLGEEEVAEDKAAASAGKSVNNARKAEIAFVKQGMTRSQARALIMDLKGGKQDAATTQEPGKPGAAADNTTHDAGEDWSTAASALIEQLKKN